MSKGRFSRVVVGSLDFRETNRFLCLGAKICDLDFFLSRWKELLDAATVIFKPFTTDLPCH